MLRAHLDSLDMTEEGIPHLSQALKYNSKWLLLAYTDLILTLKETTSLTSI